MVETRTVELLPVPSSLKSLQVSEHLLFRSLGSEMQIFININLGSQFICLLDYNHTIQTILSLFTCTEENCVFYVYMCE